MKRLLAMSLMATPITLSIHLDSAAQEQCAFNGRWEACKIYRTAKAGRVTTRKVVWLSDGKTTTYQEYECTTPNEFTSESTCNVKITEDNGRTTGGKLYHTGGRGIRIVSNAGNTTILPP